jgi:fermentation-respiration switch protein FrsA (DUF1100 family)
MKKTLVIFIVILCSLSVYAQDITGEWNGLLKVQGMQLRLVFNLTSIEGGYQATMDSPDQGAKGIPVTSVTFSLPVLKIKIAGAGIEYEGSLQGDSLFDGTFKQGGMSLPLRLTREIPEKEKVRRPQEPTQPYSYLSEEVRFKNNSDNIELAGTLTRPKQGGPFTAVILISGSGPQDRNEEVFGHKPFLVLAHHLTQQGIAVLRFDDRGTAGSTGHFSSASESDFVTDVESAVSFLRTRPEIDQTRIGLIGHSEGGIIAPQVAARDKAIAFIVLLAGVGIPGNQLLLMQQELIGKASGLDTNDLKKAWHINKSTFDLVLKHRNPDSLKEALTTDLKQSFKEMPQSLKPAGMSEEMYLNMVLGQLTTPWMADLIRYNPAPVLERVTCPVLALNGEKDLQVPAKPNLAAIEAALKKGNNSNITVRELPDLNHLFQECESGLPAEYGQLEQTFSPLALKEISSWILTTVKQ